MAAGTSRPAHLARCRTPSGNHDCDRCNRQAVDRSRARKGVSHADLEAGAWGQDRRRFDVSRAAPHGGEDARRPWRRSPRDSRIARATLPFNAHSLQPGSGSATRSGGGNPVFGTATERRNGKPTDGFWKTTEEWLLTMPKSPAILPRGRVPFPVGRAGFKPGGGRLACSVGSTPASCAKPPLLAGSAR